MPANTEELITLVIHTPERAGILKDILERHGMKVELEDFVVSHSTLRVAQRVKIQQEDLPMALRITESGECYSSASIAMKLAGMSGNLLIPVDFSDLSMRAVKMGFEMSRRLNVHPVVLHAFIAPLFTGGSPFAADGAPDILAPMESIIEESKEISTLRSAAEAKFKAFVRKIKDLQKSGDLPDIKFSNTLIEGVPEEVILSYCEQTPPMLVTMATRGVTRKEEELIGSVTAEVLDSCRVPIFTVPEDQKPIEIRDIKRLMMFCNLDQHDVLAMDRFMRMFDTPDCQITLVPVQEKGRKRDHNKIDDLCTFLTEHYPNVTFSSYVASSKEFRKDVDSYISSHDIQMLILPNKKTNVFSRIFHPTIAHKFLFERDMMMLVLPV